MISLLSAVNPGLNKMNLLSSCILLQKRQSKYDNAHTNDPNGYGYQTMMLQEHGRPKEDSEISNMLIKARLV
jgi:hypothetical protein